MKRLAAVVVALALTTTVLAPTATGHSTGGPAAHGVARRTDALLDGVRVHLQPGTRQVVTVRHTRVDQARVTFWRLGTHGWQPVRRTDGGRTGYGGLVAGARRHQGSGTTPLGTFRLLYAFGTHSYAAGHLRYRQIRRGDFWVEDNTSAYYNRYRNQRQAGFHWRLPAGRVDGSERLSDYPTQYEYSIVTDYNREQVRHRGAGIFLHVNGSGPTAGCVSAPRAFLRMLMARLDPVRRPVIAVGR